MMRNGFWLLSKYNIFFIACLLFPFFIETAIGQTGYQFPYKEAGLTERQAAAHLLSRFTYGASPGQVDTVLKIGLEKWFDQQLRGGIPNDSLQARLIGYDALNLSNEQVNETFPSSIQIIRMAMADGVITKDSLNKADRKKTDARFAEYSKQRGARKLSELFKQFINSKILRAAYSNNQLHEVLTEFWFNHFNVSFSKKDCAMFIPAYERDIIRPNILGKFENLLLATAKSPAMLLYLDNFSSAGENNVKNISNNTGEHENASIRNGYIKDSISGMIRKLRKKTKPGLNENYARELMELHTLGVDGGYTQHDVVDAARILTGWTNYPLKSDYGNVNSDLVRKIREDDLRKRGFVRDGDFFFAIDRHDANSKRVMNKEFPANGGYEEGVQLIKMLAHHPSTAGFICKKIAVHFVKDDAPQSLIDKMAKTFLDKDGDIKEVLITMTCSAEFWNKKFLRDKIKSPFELAISAVRVLDADIQQPAQIFQWAEKMGQKIYWCPAPTGFPDKDQHWINTGALLNRMNFGLAISSQQIAGIKTDLLRLNNYHEPESPSEALITYGRLLMPERDLDATLKRLTPLLNQPLPEKKLEFVINKKESKEKKIATENDLKPGAGIGDTGEREQVQKLKKEKAGEQGVYRLAYVVGILLGSPEFQRK